MHPKPITFFSQILIFMLLQVSCKEKSEEQPEAQIPSTPYSIPTQGNSWFIKDAGEINQQVYNPGDHSWTDPSVVHRTFFYLKKSGELHLAINARSESGTSELKGNFNGKEVNLEIDDSDDATIFLGSFEIEEAGYHYLDIQGVKKESLNFADITDVLLGGSATQDGIHFINEDYFYWGRRGPSVHLSYEVPLQAADIEWFYNEITVPEDNDIPGSYYMANGFGEGYFGFQVNSDTERRILFSVWSPYSTDNPEEIPDDQRVELLRKGDNVIVNDFGNEGSGGQSFLRYNWQAGTTYRFLLKGEPTENDKTDYTAWFYAPEWGEWRLIASWRRPLTSTYLVRPHSFLENFITQTGVLGRQAHYGNQWIKDTQGNWYELTRAKFTADATAMDNARMDYAGGITNDQQQFFMRNCGFFNPNTPIDSWFTRQPTATEPDLDIENLP